MKSVFKWLWPLVGVWVAGCSVMSPALNQAALSNVSFPELLAHTRQYIGQTVVLGGYVVKVDNQKTLTRLVVVQAPLGIGQEPKSKDLSQGRMVVDYKGFLDPEVYAKDRKITVGGIVAGGSGVDTPTESFPYVRIEATEIHLWPEKTPYVYDPYWDPWWWGGPYPYYWRGYYPGPWYH